MTENKSDNLQENLVLMHGDGYAFLKWYSALKGSKNNDIFEAKNVIATKGHVESPHGDLRVISVFDEVSKELVFEKREINKQMKWEYRADFKLYVDFLNSQTRYPKLDNAIEKDGLVKIWKQLNDARQVMEVFKGNNHGLEGASLEDVQKYLEKEIEGTDKI